MPELSFAVESAAPIAFAASPMLGLQLRVTNRGPETIEATALRCQIQIEPTRRRYTAEEQSHLKDLFGEFSRWGQTAKTMLWTHAAIVTPPFEGSTVCELPVPCTFDFNVGATKYFYGLDEGLIPLRLQFSGTAFYRDAIGALQAAPISWDQETRFELPVNVWQAMMDRYYPETAWLCLRRDVFDRLYQYKIENMIPTWDEVLERCSLALESAVAR